MLVSGNELVVAWRGDQEDRSKLQSLLSVIWPNSVVEDGDNEKFVYEDESTRGSWEQHGRTEENKDGMLHILFCESQLTFVHDGINTKFIADNFLIHSLTRA